MATAYWPEHNTRFTQPPASADDFHVRPPSPRALAAILHLETRRVIANDWVVRYRNRLFQLERRSPLPPARSTVPVCEDEAGTIAIRYRRARVACTEITGPRPVPHPPTSVGAPPAARAPASGSSVPCADHPWRQITDDYRHARNLGVARDRRTIRR